MSRFVGMLAVFALASVLGIPGAAYAQVGNIAGTVRDSSGSALPGVTVEVTSPALIEKVRSTTTDGSGRYQIVSLPVGTYSVTFRLDSFSTVTRGNVELTSDFTAPVNAEMRVGNVREVVTVTATAPVVDVQNARQRQVFTGEEVADLPTTRNLGDLVQLVPGIAISAIGGGNSEPRICSGGQGQGGFSGALSGCSPIFEGFNAHASMNDGASINQGRIQVDGLGINSFAGGGRSSYISDTGNAQEITFTLSGALGESETGGTTINVVPRTGGNRYSGNYFTAYSSERFYDKNDGRRPTTFSNRLIREYDVNGAFGGPILRDRLWFYSAARRQDRESKLTGNYRNLNAGVFGANYQYDPASPLNQGDRYQNVNTRLTYQATRRDKFNIFWDEQYTCENPCRGGGAGVSVEATASVITRPLHVAQLSWSNPLTNRILLDGGFSHYGSRRNESRHLFEENYTNIPRIVESGATTGVVPGAFTTGITSGSVNNAINWKIENWQSRASASYITGSHNLKVGYQGQHLSRVSTPYFNDLRLQYNYATPAATCTATKPAPGAVTNQNWCGLFPDGRRVFDGRPESEPLGPALATAARPPVPTSVTAFIPGGSDEAAWFTAFYLQDQWTVNRFTLNGALRYDNAQSRFGTTCVGPDVYKADSYCLNDPAGSPGNSGKAVNFHDITPRWGVAWDLFGNGSTAIKWSMGKYLEGSQAGGIYTASNPASGGRTINSYQRVWRDLNGDRVVDCDLSVPTVAPPAGQALPSNGECGNPAGIGAAATLAANSRRFGRSPSDLDELGLAIGLGTIYCDADEIAKPSVATAIRNYCSNYFAAGGSNLLEGWGRRQYEWQQSLGVQHQILSRLSGEVTWNKRKQYNQRVTDLILSGCDLYSADPGGTVDTKQCMADLLNYASNDYDFYGVRAPVDPRLPDGGGYLIEGIATAKLSGVSGNSGVNAVTIAPKGSRNDYWSGVDTNFIFRGPRGLRVSGGTSTGRRNDNVCGLLVNDPPSSVRLEEGRVRECENIRPFQTNVRGTATYTIPWVDVLVSSAFSVRPGSEVRANYTVNVQDLVWGPNSQDRVGTAPVGNTTGQVSTNLVDNATYGERITLVDLKISKNIRFRGKRFNIGADIYNAFNSDAARAYCGTFPNLAEGIEGCSGTSAEGTLVGWSDVTNIVTPRYGRFQVRFDF
jgi:hypothetical protein